MRQVLETRILNYEVKFTLKEILEIDKKDFCEAIIGAIHKNMHVVEDTTRACVTNMQELNFNIARIKRSNVDWVQELRRSHSTRIQKLTHTIKKGLVNI